MKKDIPDDCKKNFEAWELRLLECANELRRGRKPCMIVVRWDGRLWHIHDCLSAREQIIDKV